MPMRRFPLGAKSGLGANHPITLTENPLNSQMRLPCQVAWYLGWYFTIPVFPYQVRSTSTADDMKYDFDAVAYLRNAQHPHDPALQRQEFLHKRALWLAYECETASVLLIDEIDKAPRDFPNDLLLELDQHQFQHPFLNKVITPRSGAPPL